MTNFLHGCRLLWLAVTTGWLIAATTALAGPSELRYAAIVPNYGRPFRSPFSRPQSDYAGSSSRAGPSTIASATAGST